MEPPKAPPKNVAINEEEEEEGKTSTPSLPSCIYPWVQCENERGAPYTSPHLSLIHHIISMGN